MSPPQTETGGCRVRSGLGITTAMPFRIGLITRCDVLNADEIEKFQAFSYRCAWVVIEGDTATGYVIE